MQGTTNELKIEVAKAVFPVCVEEFAKMSAFMGTSVRDATRAAFDIAEVFVQEMLERHLDL